MFQKPALTLKKYMCSWIWGRQNMRSGSSRLSASGTKLIQKKVHRHHDCITLSRTPLLPSIRSFHRQCESPAWLAPPCAAPPCTTASGPRADGVSSPYPPTSNPLASRHNRSQFILRDYSEDGSRRQLRCRRPLCKIRLPSHRRLSLII